MRMPGFMLRVRLRCVNGRLAEHQLLLAARETCRRNRSPVNRLHTLDGQMAICPNCSANVETNVETCVNCGASFLGASSWKPLKTAPPIFQNEAATNAIFVWHGMRFSLVLVLWGLMTILLSVFTINHIAEELRLINANANGLAGIILALCAIAIASVLTTALCLKLHERWASALVFISSIALLLAMLSLIFVVSHCPHGCNNISSWFVAAIHAMLFASIYSAFVSAAAWRKK